MRANPFRDACIARVPGDPEFRYRITRAMCERRLNRRERDVAWGVLAGATNPEIAHGLFMTDQTVKNYLTMIYQKVKVRSRTQLVLRLLGVY